MTGTWYFDFVSPFAYLALGEVEALALELELNLRPVLFGAMLKHYGQLGPAEVAPKRLQTYRMCVWKARERGIAFRFPPAHPFNSLELLRLATALDAEKGAVRAVFDIVWREGRDPRSEATLALLRERLGIADGDALIAATGAKERLRENTEAALAAGGFGVPTHALGDQLFWGTDALPMARAYLADPHLFDHEEMHRVDHLPMGVERPR
jgi:2-hydroxychromene-2-carboxylate isomerase